MFNSIKSWIAVPFSYKPFIKRNGAGSKIYGDTVESKCYPVGTITLVTNTAGAEITSTTQLYVDGNESIKVTDTVILNGEERPIHSISSFYRNGIVDIKVVYL